MVQRCFSAHLDPPHLDVPLGDEKKLRVTRVDLQKIIQGNDTKTRYEKE